MNYHNALLWYEKEHNVVIDTATPQSWFDAINTAMRQPEIFGPEDHIDPRMYWWSYEKGMMSGKPIHRDTVRAEYLQHLIFEKEAEQNRLLQEQTAKAQALLKDIKEGGFSDEQHN